MASQYNERESERGRSGRGSEDYRRFGRSQQERGYEGRNYDDRSYANRGEMRAFFGDDDYERRDEGQWGERRFGRGDSYNDDEARERAYPRSSSHSFGRSSGRDYEWSGGNMGREYGNEELSERNWRQGNGGYDNEYSSRSRESWSTPGPYTGHGPQGYKRSDERILEDVNERLTQHGQLDASQIQVKVKDGEVTLTGTVNDRYAKRWAEDIIESCSGVKDVQNQLRVKQESQSFGTQQGMQHNQAEMKRAAKQ